MISSAGMHQASGGLHLPVQTRDFYRSAMEVLQRDNVPFLVGGAYAFERYTGVARHTKDFDVFIRRGDYARAAQSLSCAGYHTELTYPHWLGKAFFGEDFVDLIFGGGNAVAVVDEKWFEHAVDEQVFELPVKLCPPEEIIWSKSFVMERERFDGADIMHMLRAKGENLDWMRMLQRFGCNWRVLLSHLVIFGFAYPAEKARIPAWVIQELAGRLQHEAAGPPAPSDHVCQGTLLSRAQYLMDVDRWGYADARLHPRGNMSEQEIAHWTAAIDKG